MKSKFLQNLVLLIFLSGVLYNTSVAGDRVVIIERFTSSTCGPCASNNPIIDAFVNSVDQSKLLGLAYHMNWPAPGNDPMYIYNANDNNSRRGYYGVTGIPQVQMDGLLTLQPTYSQSQLTTAFDSRTSMFSPISIVVRDSTYGDSILVRVTVICELPLTNTAVTLHVALMEKMITYPSPPGTNGERLFPDVMRKMLPTGAGTNLDLYPGSRRDFEFRAKVDPLWITNQVRSVAFVQASNKEVLNAASKLSDFCLMPNISFKVVTQGTSQNANYKIAVPYTAEGYNSAVTFTAAIEGAPAGVTATFPSGNVLTNFPDSLSLNVSSTAGVPAGIYNVIITGTNALGKSHKTAVTYNVGKNFCTVSTNKPNVNFTVDGTNYNAAKFFVWDLNSSHTIGTASTQTFGNTRYIFQNWSVGGDTNQTINISPDVSNYTGNFKTQYKLTATTTPAGLPVTITSGNQYWDENVNVNLDINPRQVQHNGRTYYFQRWLGGSTNSYSGPNPSVTLNMANPITQIAIFDTINSVGIASIGTEIPVKYNLYQNYPNPFNPTTNIKFDIPSLSLATLKVYDINGREVAELVNQNLQAGMYQYTFDASGLSSGIYYFKLVSGEFNQIKKMILLK